MNRTKNASRNVFWGILSKLVALTLPFATRTIMIYTMGMQYVGLGSLFTSVLQVLSFAELGIGNALVFSMYKPIAERDEPKVCALLNFYKKAYRVIGLAILGLGLLIMPFLPRLIAGDLPDGVNLYILYAAYLTNNVLGYFLFAYKQSLFIASQRVDMVNKVGMLLQIASGTAQIVILLAFRNYYAYVMVIPVITLLNNVCTGILANRHYPQYRCAGDIERDELKTIEKKVGGMVFQKIGGIVLSSVDTIVISAFLGLTALAFYQNYYYIITTLFGFLSVLMQSMIAGVGNSVASETLEKNYSDFKKFNFIYYWIVTFCSCCLAALYQPFMELWVGSENMLSDFLMCQFVLYFFVHKWMDMEYVYMEACGIWWESRLVPFAAAVLNLTVNLLLVRIIGLLGILVSTIIAVILVYNPGYAYVLFKYYFKRSALGFAKRQLLYFVAALFMVTMTCAVCALVPFEGVALLLSRGVICTLLPNSILILIWNRVPEFKGMIDFVRKIVRIGKGYGMGK